MLGHCSIAYQFVKIFSFSLPTVLHTQAVIYRPALTVPPQEKEPVDGDLHFFIFLKVMCGCGDA